MLLKPSVLPSHEDEMKLKSENMKLLEREWRGEGWDMKSVSGITFRKWGNPKKNPKIY